MGAGLWRSGFSGASSSEEKPTHVFAGQELDLIRALQKWRYIKSHISPLELLYAVLNPEIPRHSKEAELGNEGCLSIVYSLISESDERHHLVRYDSTKKVL